MEIIVLSYAGGMSGDFITHEISKNPNFYTNDIIHLTNRNMYRVKNILDVVGVDAKNMPNHLSWPIDQDKLQKLNDYYGDSRLILNTHWFNLDAGKINFPNQSVLLFSANLAVIRLSYCMVWIKAQLNSVDIWDSRKEEILKLIAQDHVYKKQLAELLEPGQYHNWKFLSYVYQPETLKDNRPDLSKFITNWYQYYLRRQMYYSSAMENSQSWIPFDITDIMMNNSGFEYIEEKLNISLNRQSFKNYFDKNFKILHDEIGLTISDLEHDHWFDSLYNYCHEHLKTAN